MLRLRQKHSRNLDQAKVSVDADKLLATQSVRAAGTAAVVAIIILNIVWAYTASASGKFFPWFSILQGAAIGKVVQKFGRGFDWRFPAIAGTAAWLGAFSGNLFIALMVSGTETAGVSRSWWEILLSFWLNTVSVVDVIFAFTAAVIAMFYSKRQLNRHEVYALRNKMAEKHDS
jgi:hypothetical protein